MTYRLRFFEYSNGEEHFLKEIVSEKRIPIPRKRENIFLSFEDDPMQEQNYTVLGVSYDYTNVNNHQIQVEIMCKVSNCFENWWEQ